jgi:tetratricopeptide (TPR) repeat protein
VVVVAMKDHHEGGGMKKISLAIMVLMVLALPLSVMAEDPIAEAKAQLKIKTLDAYKKAVDLSLKGVQAQPQSFEANWVAAKAFRLYGDESKKHNVSGWKGICEEYGEKAMAYAEKARTIDPKKVDGYFWYGCAVGTYADGVSIVTAIRKGLKNKTQSALESSYKIDKTYEEFAPIKALGRFWFVLPWGMRDWDKSKTLLEEFAKANPNDAEGQLYLGEVYNALKEKDKAKAVLTKAAAAPAAKDKYYADQAKALLGKL